MVVDDNLSVRGGVTQDVDTQTMFGAFAQIGHGGPGISGDVSGNITVLVRRSSNVITGSDFDSTTITQKSLNNYAMIGNGDLIKDSENTPASLFRTEAQGIRSGNIVF